MKFRIDYRTRYMRLHPNSPHRIKCARFISVWRRGSKIIDAASPFEAESQFIREMAHTRRGEEREVLSVKQHRRRSQ